MCLCSTTSTALWFPSCSQTGKWVMYLRCSLHAARESLMHNAGRRSPPPFLALQPRQCFCTTLRFRHRGRSCGCSSVTARQSKRSLRFIRPHRGPFLSCFIEGKVHVLINQCGWQLLPVCRTVPPIPCGGHPLAPSGHGRSCRLDGECLVKGERRGSVQGCWQTEHTVSRPGCPLVGETLKHRSRWWLQLLNRLVHKWFIQGCKPSLVFEAALLMQLQPNFRVMVYNLFLFSLLHFSRFNCLGFLTVCSRNVDQLKRCRFGIERNQL